MRVSVRVRIGTGVGDVYKVVINNTRDVMAPIDRDAGEDHQVALPASCFESLIVEPHGIGVNDEGRVTDEELAVIAKSFNVC